MTHLPGLRLLLLLLLAHILVRVVRSAIARKRAAHRLGKIVPRALLCHTGTGRLARSGSEAVGTNTCGSATTGR